MENYMRTHEVLQYLNISRTTLYRFRKEGLPVRVVRGTLFYKMSDLDQWLTTKAKAGDPNDE